MSTAEDLPGDNFRHCSITRTDLQMNYFNCSLMVHGACKGFRHSFHRTIMVVNIVLIDRSYE